MILILLSFFAGGCAQVQPRYHTVERGQTLSRIAELYSVSVAELRNHNSDATQGGLRSGMKLFVPFEQRPDWDLVLAGDIVRDADLDSSYSSAAPNFVWPVVGYVSSAFGPRRGNMHDGIDIVALEGTSVKAARSGHVIYAHNRIGGYGNMVIIRHADTFSTVYAHLSAFNVKKGQFIAKGQTLGRVGQTGHANGPHLHFEVRNHRAPVNPLLYLQVQYAHNILRR